MMNPINPVALQQQMASGNTELRTEFAAGKTAQRLEQMETREVFKNFVAGTFYQQMLKAMRSSQGEVQYLGGGQGEKMFRSQLDQQISEQLAMHHGDAFAAPLYDNFEAHLNQRMAAEPPQIDYLA